MKMSGPDVPVRCVLTINLSHSADTTLRKSEVTCVGVVGASESHWLPTQSSGRLLHCELLLPGRNKGRGLAQ